MVRKPWEVNPETYAVCKSDLYMKSLDGKDAENIKFGSTLARDAHGGLRFDYQLANPPYGKEWKMDKDAIEAENERGHAGRFGAGLPRISDGQLLFLCYMLGKSKPQALGQPLLSHGHNLVRHRLILCHSVP